MNAETYSPGLETVIAGETAISTLEGGLHYRGYAVEELASGASFEETAYLLLHGELPRAAELQAFQNRLHAAAHLPPELTALLARIPTTAPMMDALRTAVSTLAHFEPDLAATSHEYNVGKAERLLAKIPLALWALYRQRRNWPAATYDPSKSFAANVLAQLTAAPATPLAVRAMEATLIMYAEHEFNASAFTARVVCSTLSDMHSAITAAIGALKGALHGGANERVMEVLAEVGSVDRAERWLRAALAQKRRVMGFGHRVYKHRDPRAEYLKPMCRELAATAGDLRWEAIADVLETMLWREKQLPPNLDWPSARIYHYLGLPVDLYTPLFVVSRVTGWCAHVMEQQAQNRLIRPRSRYVGPAPRAFVPLNAR